MTIKDLKDVLDEGITVSIENLWGESLLECRCVNIPSVYLPFSVSKIFVSGDRLIIVISEDDI